MLYQKLVSSIQDIQNSLNEYYTSDIQENLKEIELLYGIIRGSDYYFGYRKLS